MNRFYNESLVSLLQRRLGATMWEMNKSELQSPELAEVIEEREEYWIRIKNYRSKNSMSHFFDFCPYITKENGRVVIRDTLCYKSKGFFCQL